MANCLVANVFNSKNGSSAQSKKHLLLYAHEQLVMSLLLFAFHYYICGNYDVQKTSAVESYRHFMSFFNI